MSRKHCFLPMFRHVFKIGQTLGNISEKHMETSNVSEFENIFAFLRLGRLIDGGLRYCTFCIYCFIIS